eukprot:TRINITY_DN2696_c0_g1_i1.p1 TRINITY_DN2696_c0_g1~~TRINITY_DN2696_c0_g1_i1.p1  ORF type:complete len:864 (+),score=281.67 TRINITY_DN2696_c0_g1_i1:29-2593(+)
MSSVEEIVALLVTAFKGDTSIHERFLGWGKETPENYCLQLMEVIADDNLETEIDSKYIRQFASELVKLVICFDTWSQFDEVSRESIKDAVLPLLGNDELEVRMGAMSIVIEIALVEIPYNLWPDLLERLTSCYDNETVFIRETALTVLGHICEKSDPKHLVEYSDNILNSIARGLDTDEEDSVKFEACKALQHTLVFLKDIMKDPEGGKDVTNMLLGVINSSDDEKSMVAALQTINGMAEMYYDLLEYTAEDISEMMLAAMDIDSEKIARQGIDFFTIVAQTESEINFSAAEYIEYGEEPERESLGLCKMLASNVVPKLCAKLTHQDEDLFDDQIQTIVEIAANCLIHLSIAIGDDIVDIVTPFLEENLSDNSNWRNRSGAIMAFASIIEGPSSQSNIRSIIHESIPDLLEWMNDENICVRDGSVYCLARIFEHHDSHCWGEFVTDVVPQLLKSLDDSARVASNVCYAIHSLSKRFEKFKDEETNRLSPFVKDFIVALMERADEQDKTNFDLLSSCYLAMAAVVRAAAVNTFDVLTDLMTHLINRLEETMNLSGETGTYQTHICTLLYEVISRLGNKISKEAHESIVILQSMIPQAANKDAVDEIMLLIGRLALTVGADFEDYLSDELIGHLSVGLQNINSGLVVMHTIGAIMDIAKAVDDVLKPYLPQLIEPLIEGFSSDAMTPDICTSYIELLGDLVLIAGEDFLGYLEETMTVLGDIGFSVTIEDVDDIEHVNHVNDLRYSLLVFLSSVFHGFHRDQCTDSFEPYVPHIVDWLKFVIQDESTQISLYEQLCTVVHDMLPLYYSQLDLTEHRDKKDWIIQLIDHTKNSPDVTVREESKRLKRIYDIVKHRAK